MQISAEPVSNWESYDRKAEMLQLHQPRPPCLQYKETKIYLNWKQGYI